VSPAWDPWLSGIALAVLAALGLWVRRRFENRDDDGSLPTPPAKPHHHPVVHDDGDDEDRTPA
jgi:MYXO-CTERM domain-containing protein